jgi:hypothetical protein
MFSVILNNHVIEYDKYFSYFCFANSYLKKGEEMKAHKFQHLLRTMRQTVIKNGKHDTIIFMIRSLLLSTLYTSETWALTTEISEIKLFGHSSLYVISSPIH